MALTAAQIYGYAIGAGFAPARAIIATAVALAESSGDPTSHCLNCFPGVTEDSRGLWQINVDAHPDLAGLDLFDPATNAKAAYQVSTGGQSFSPWTTYKNGAYTQYLGAVSAVTGAPALTGPTLADGGTVTSAGLNFNPFDLFGIPGTITNALGKDLWQIAIQGAVVIGGVALVVAGLWRAVQPAAQKVATVAADAGKAAAVA